VREARGGSPLIEPALAEVLRACCQGCRLAGGEGFGEDGGGDGQRRGGAESLLFRPRVYCLVARDADVCWNPVDTNPERGAGSAESAKEGVEGGEEVFSGLGAWCAEGGDGRLTVGEDVDIAESWQCCQSSGAEC
jgi:hypothetical protein